MKTKLNIKTKICLFVLAPISIFILFLILYVGTKNARDAVSVAEEKAIQIAEKQRAQIATLINKYTTNVSDMAIALSGNSELLDERQREIYGSIIFNAANKSEQHVWAIWQSDFFADSNYMDNEWVFVQSNNNGAKVINSVFNFEHRFAPCLKTSSPSISALYQYEGNWLMNITSPITHQNEIQGYVGMTIKASDFISATQGYDAIDDCEVTILNNSCATIYATNNANIGENFGFNNDTTNISEVKKLIASGTFSARQITIDGSKYFAIICPIKIDNHKNWAVGVKIPIKNVIKTAIISLIKSVIVTLIGLLIIFVIVILVARNITKPIQDTTQTLKLLSLGDTANIKNLNVNSNDELQEMAESLNMVVDGMRKSETFALNIGDGNFESDFTTLSEKDRLGEALIKMRDNLHESKLNEAKRKEEEELRNWATEGIAKFGDILRQDQNNLKTLGFNIMTNLIDYLKVNQGALFVINDDDENDIFFSMVTAIAYGRDKYMQKDVRIGDGLIGRCIYERRTIYLKEIPDDYAKITSGLGTSNPRCILIVPCILNDEILGVIEIASFNELKPHEIEFVEKIGESIGSTVANVRVAEKTSKLLQSSQLQKEELTAQEEELRQNLEEMQATQEDLRRQMEDNAIIRDELAREKSLMDSLMENINDTIYFKDLDSKFVKVSRSYLKTVDINNYDEAIGKSDFDFCKDQDEAQRYYDDEQRIIRTGQPIINQIQRELRNSGVIYTSTSKYPLYDANGNIIGTFGLTTDVTNSKLVDKINDKIAENNQE